MGNSRFQIISIVVLTLVLVTVGLAQTRAGKLGVGAAGIGYYFVQSDLSTKDFSGGGAVTLSYSIAENVSLRSLLGVGYLTGKQPSLPGTSIQTNLYHWDLALSFDMLPHSQFNPFILVGSGALYFDPRTKDGDPLPGAGRSRFEISYSGGIGFDYFFDEFWSFTLSAEGVGTFTSRLDGLKGSSDDMYGRVSLGLRYHFFDQDFVKRMIDAFENRGK